MLLGTRADYSQNNPQWANKWLGWSNWETIGRYGCMVTAMANVAQAQGTDYDPYTINVALRNRGQFVRDSYGQLADTAGYRSLTVVAPKSRYVTEYHWAQNQLAPLGLFDVRSSVNTEIIIEIDYHPEIPALQSHFVRVIGLNNAKNDVEIVDSYTGKRVWLSSISSRVGKSPAQIIWSAGVYQRA